MDSQEFRKAAHAAVDESKVIASHVCDHRLEDLLISAVANYYDTLPDRQVVSSVEPGYLRKLLPSGPPQRGEKWDDIQRDIESKIMPGLTHWYFYLSSSTNDS